MQALIDPRFDRVCQIEPDDQTFPVAEPLFWTTCPDNCTTEWTYVNGQLTNTTTLSMGPHDKTIGQLYVGNPYSNSTKSFVFTELLKRAGDESSTKGLQDLSVNAFGSSLCCNLA